MKYGVIDIGSNSVRLMISDGEKSIKKFLKTTRLAEGMGEENLLKAEAIERTVAAVLSFKCVAEELGVEKIMVFATAAVRKAKNKAEFINEVLLKSNLCVDVVSGEEEAKLGYFGALNGADGGIIDVGGASTEITVVKNGKVLFSKSFDVGAVSTTDVCGQSKQLVVDFLNEIFDNLTTFDGIKFYSIGGTATTLASVDQALDVYDPDRVDGYCLTLNNVERLMDKLFSLSVEERKSITGLQPDRAKVIASGVAILYTIMKNVKIENLFVSEKDNLEGYLMIKRGI